MAKVFGLLLAYASLLGLCLSGSVEALSRKQTIHGQNAAQNPDKVVERLLALHNAQRAKQGAKPLVLNAKLSAAAKDYAEFLARTGKFGHTENGSPGQRIKKQGYSYRADGENIAKGQPTAESVVNAWMHSSGHRANILNKGFKDVGFGVARDPKGRMVWVTDFGTPR